LLDDLGDRRGYSHLKEEALDRIKWRNHFGRGCGPVVLQMMMIALNPPTWGIPILTKTTLDTVITTSTRIQFTEGLLSLPVKKRLQEVNARGEV
jgi:hypothetical protein